MIFFYFWSFFFLFALYKSITEHKKRDCVDSIAINNFHIFGSLFRFQTWILFWKGSLMNTAPYM